VLDRGYANFAEYPFHAIRCINLSLLLSTRLPPVVAAKIIHSRDAPIHTNPYTALVVGVSDHRTQKELVPMSRTLAALASLVLTVLGVVVLFSPDCAYACSCAMPPGTQKERAERALSSSEAVFSGEVAAIEKEAATASHPGTATATLRVSEVWKGPERATLEVSTASQESACGFPFEEGREYLVYAYGKHDLNVDLCSETKPLSIAEADLAVLGNGEKPKSSDALTDTSGGVPARAVVGLAGLAMAASLLVMVRLVRSA
jgi:hypothetical protein